MGQENGGVSGEAQGKGGEDEEEGQGTGEVDLGVRESDLEDAGEEGIEEEGAGVEELNLRVVLVANEIRL